ncbi:DUF3696 domain-containing protein [Xanthobacter autotrophicus]|uniref:DUF3696 domain-containing protein n=1 Tax=Xanthobacter autotrophicus TaxID=280 RepID=UPI0037292437
MTLQLRIEGFKAFREETFELRPLTVLAGVNGAGKTSVIQALLMFSQAADQPSGYVELNGPFRLNLGTFNDILNIDSPQIRIALRDDSHDPDEEAFVFSGGETDQFASVKSVGRSGRFAMPRQAGLLQYLSAERLGPRIVQNSSALPHNLIEVGCLGEFTAQVLHERGSTSIDPKRFAPEVDPKTTYLKAHAEAWLSKLTRTVWIDTVGYRDIGSYGLKFRVDEDWVSPTNMGFGLTYALPIVVAALTAQTDGLLIVENPEAHLHPAGQSQMGHFLATMAAAGVRVLVETHSDHVLNGIRRAIGESCVLSAERAVTYYFDPSQDRPEKLEFTAAGGLSHWPSGFFDQYQIDVSALTRIRRPRRS